jgi:hypothetical protein
MSAAFQKDGSISETISLRFAAGLHPDVLAIVKRRPSSADSGLRHIPMPI